MRSALIVGIDHYPYLGSLTGCVRDARAVAKMLEYHDNGDLNFKEPRVLSGTDSSNVVKQSEIKTKVRELFNSEAEIALLYFAGHGYIEDTGGFLCAGDCMSGDDGFSLTQLMTLVNASRARNNVVILDSCYSGVIGDRPFSSNAAEIKDGTTILTASTSEQQAMEGPDGRGGIFTTLLLEALGGAAANLLGDVTPGSVYTHIDLALGTWGQRPVFKTNVKRFVSLRRAAPPIPLLDLRELATLFPQPDHYFPLDPTYEPERSEEQRIDPDIPLPDPRNTAIFAVLQKYVKVNLVQPVDAPHMWHAAMFRKGCELTRIGRYYRDLVAKRRI